MNRKQSNKMTAYQGVLGVMEKHHKTCSTFPALMKAVEEFSSLKEEIMKVAARREADTTGETSAKNKARRDLARYASKLAALGMAYAFDSSDPELEAALDYSYTDIEHVKDSETLQITGSIYEVLNQDLPGLEDYLVSREDIDELGRLRESFNDAIATRGAVKSRRVADTRALTSLFHSCDDLLYRKIDRLMIRMKEEHPRFHDAYFSARKIYDR